MAAEGVQGGAREGGQVGAPDRDPGTEAGRRPSPAAAVRDGEGRGGAPPRAVQGTSPVRSENPVHTLKVLALKSSGRELHTVLNFLRGVPCLERLYVIFHKHYEMDKENEPQYDPLHPIKCLETHLKKVVFKSFIGYEKQLYFAKFFVLNAKVLKKIEFEGYCDYNSESLAYQHRILQVENRASRDARIEFRQHDYHHTYLDKHIHDLSVADPFRLCIFK